MDPLLKSFADQGVVALSFGLLLIYFLAERREERRTAAEERGKFIAITERATLAIENATETQHEMTRTLEAMQRTQDAIATDVRDLKRWRDTAK